MEEFPATVTIRHYPYICPVESKKLLVQHGDQWIPITEWLVELANKSYFDRRNAASDICFWYNRGEKAFRLLDLPPEIRLAIYEDVIAPQGEVFPLSKATKPPFIKYDTGDRFGRYVEYPEATMSECENARVTLGIGYLREDISKQEGIGRIIRGNKSWSKELRDDIPAPDISLFFVSKQVGAEALKLAGESPTRCFIDHRMFAAVASSKIGVAIQHNILGRVELSFTCRAWFQFFGINQVSPTLSQNETASLGPYLERLPPTCRLTIRFRNPEDGYEHCDPFCDPWKRDTDRSSCQKVLDIWIATFAFRHIKHIQTIYITGYIKNVQRQRILAYYQRRYDEDTDSTVGAEVQDILNTPSYRL